MWLLKLSGAISPESVVHITTTTISNKKRAPGNGLGYLIYGKWLDRAVADVASVRSLSEELISGVRLAVADAGLAQVGEGKRCQKEITKWVWLVGQ